MKSFHTDRGLDIVNHFALKMAPMSQEDLEWFKSTFHPIPKPQLPDDSVEYSLYLIPSGPAPAAAEEAAETRSRLHEVQKTASELTKTLLKDYIWQRDAFSLEIAKENGKESAVAFRQRWREPKLTYIYY